MKNLSEILLEASIRNKQRREQFAKSLFDTDKNNFKSFRTLGIVTAENPDSQQLDKRSNKKLLDGLKKMLKRDNLVYIPIKGKFAGNTENTLLIINPSLDAMKYYAGNNEQTSFFFIKNENNNTIAEYWEKSDPTMGYDKRANDYKFINKTDVFIKLSQDASEYTIIGDDFKFLIDASVFNSVHESITKNLSTLEEKDREYTLYISTNGVTQMASVKREMIYGGIVTE